MSRKDTHFREFISPDPEDSDFLAWSIYPNTDWNLGHFEMKGAGDDTAHVNFCGDASAKHLETSIEKLDKLHSVVTAFRAKLRPLLVRRLKEKSGGK